MRTSRSILYTALGTVLCLLYVFQQTEIVKLGYKITSARKALEACCDRKTSLVFAVSRLESPQNLDENLFFKNEGFEMAKDFRLVKLGPEKEISGSLMMAHKTSPGGIFSLRRFAFHSLFADRQAEAKTIK